MMLFFIRIPVTVLYAYYLYKSLFRSPGVSGGDMIFLMGVGLAGGIIVAILWAPVVGEKLADPLTSTFIQETSLPSEPGRLVQSIMRAQRRGWHRLALVLVFLEGVRRPTLPTAPLLGLRSVRPGSLLEKWLAKEVYHYNNIQNCLHAYTILRERHGVIPPLHNHPEVNLAISNLTRERPPEATTIPLKKAPPAVTPKRNSTIKLFEAADSAEDSPSHQVPD